MFAHTLVRYLGDLHMSTAGQALAALTARQENGRL
jgi:heme oxygenase